MDGQHFERLFHLFPQMLCICGSYRYTVKFAEGRPVSTEHSAGCQATTGYAPAEYTADPELWINMVYPDDRNAVFASMAEVMRGDPSVTLEHRIVHKDGGVRWVRNTIIPCYQCDGTLARYDGLVEDITDRKRNERLFEQLVEFAPDAMVIANSAGNILRVNRQTEHLFGYRRSELLGQPVEILVPERFRDRHPQQQAAYRSDPQVRPIGVGREVLARRKDGSEFLAEIRLSPLDTEEGMMVSSAIRDITERKQMEKSLRERESQLLAARRIQQHLLPHKPPQVTGFEIAGASLPADFVGGDYFDYLTLSNGSTGIIVADVVGHGLPAALLASSMHSLVRALASHETDVGEILKRVNTMLMDDNDDEGLLGTALLGSLDAATRSFVYASAGNPAGHIISREGIVTARLKSTAMALGVIAGVDYPVAGPYFMRPGDVLVLATDGVLEAMSAAGEYFGTPRLLDVIRSTCCLSAREIVDHVNQQLGVFVSPGRAIDDATVVVVKCLPEQPELP